MRKILLSVSILLFISACYWENEADLFPGSDACDTLDVSFSEEVVPILSTNCYACHSNENAPDYSFGIALEDHADVLASSELIVGAIKHLDGYPAMPKNADQLDSCNILIIGSWVNQGSRDN